MSKKADFTPPPQYSQTRNSNDTYTAVVTVKHDADGTVTQSLQIINKR
jgi:ferredoxin-NADP reductase